MTDEIAHRCAGHSCSDANRCAHHVKPVPRDAWVVWHEYYKDRRENRCPHFEAETEEKA